MAGSVSPAARAQGPHLARCPSCGSGDLYTIDITRRDGGVWRGVYCAGEYDRDRRRFLRRSCGFAGAVPDGDAPAVVARIAALPVAG